MSALLLRTKLDSEQRRYAEVAKSSGEALLDLVSDVLDFSKIEAGKLELESVSFDVRDVVNNTLNILADHARSRHLQLMAFVDPRISHSVYGDPARLQQVLMNFTNNAIKFTERGEVVVRVDIREDTDSDIALRFCVSDTGMGIPADRLDRLFKCFSQVDASTTRKHGGTGLGLAICKQLANLMGGEVAVESEFGKGSRFWLDCSYNKGTADSDLAEVPDELQGVRVLTVAENRTTLRILHEYTQAFGLQTSTATDQTDAMKLLATGVEDGAPFGVLIVDADATDFTASQLCAEVRGNESLTPIRILLLSAFGQPNESVDEGLVDAVLAKPLRQSDLWNAIVTTVVPVVPQPVSATKDVRQTTRATSARVLVAEDNEINRLVAGKVLSQAGYECDIVVNGREALEALEQHHYDLVLMDCQMPDMDGFEATTEYRRRESQATLQRQPLPIIALTANALSGDRERCLAAGMTDYISKPFDPDKLIDLIEHHLAELVNG
jgi:CheY-like chemotaxis protein